jgi:hypothetical protein
MRVHTIYSILLIAGCLVVVLVVVYLSYYYKIQIHKRWGRACPLHPVFPYKFRVPPPTHTVLKKPILSFH